MSFFYNYFGDMMKIYIDLILLLNFFFDFLLLLGVSIILRRSVKIYRVIISAFLGSLSIFLLFIKLTNFQLFVLKFFISLLMIFVCFGFRNLKYTVKNLFFLYTLSMVLGGGLYFLNVEFSYKHEGLVFYHNGLGINTIILCILSPIIIYIYIRQVKILKNHYHQYYNLTIYFNEFDIVNCSGYLDTGNKLVDPYEGNPIILFYGKKKRNYKYYLVPYKGVAGSGLLKCIKAEKIDIKGVGIKRNILVGLMEDEILIDGVDCILNTKLLEG